VLGQIALRSEGHAYAWTLAASDFLVPPRSLIAERLCDMLRKDKLLASLPTKAFSNLVIFTRHVQRTVSYCCVAALSKIAACVLKVLQAGSAPKRTCCPLEAITDHTSSVVRSLILLLRFVR